jgi:multidrug efflux system membrane fusion protein
MPAMDEPLTRAEIDSKTISRPPVRRRRRLRWLWLGLALLVVGVLAWRLLAPGTPSGKPAQAPPQEVGAAKIISGDMQLVLDGLGTVTPLTTVTVQTQINGQLMYVGFKEGQMVQKGDLLAQIDPRPYEVALEQAQGALMHDTAALKEAQTDLARYQKLGRQDSIAQQQIADQEYTVQQDQGSVMTDQASIDSAKLNLTYCRITAPVTGRVGLRLVDPGNYVQTTSTTGIVVLTQLQPISVVFVLPEDNFNAVWQAVRAGRTLDVAAYNRTNAKLIAQGTLASVDNEVDTTTGTVKLRANFPNDDEALFPNEFVNARLVLQTLKGVVKAPVAAVQHGAPGAFVYLVKPDNTVAVQVVKTGITDGDDIQILSGVKPGDTVVVDGVDRLRDGSKVRITADAADAATATNNGPGAPPGEQTGNTTPVPNDQLVPPPAGK